MDQAWTQRIQACVFDAYGTLFDVHSAVGKYRTQLGERADPVSQLWRTKQLEYTWLRSLMGKHVDFWRVTQDALDFAFAAHGLTDHDLRYALMEAYLRLDCYAEVSETLQKLKQQGYRTAVLSNGSPMMLKAAVRHAGIQHLIDIVLSVEAVGIYKPWLSAHNRLRRPWGQVTWCCPQSMVKRAISNPCPAWACQLVSGATGLTTSIPYCRWLLTTTAST